MPITNVSVKFKSQWSDNASFDFTAIVGDVMTAIIEFTCNDSFSAIDFLFGLPVNTLPKTTYETSGYAFLPAPSLRQQFVGLKDTSLIFIRNVGSDFGTAVFDDLGSNNYRITHTFLVNPLPQSLTQTPNEFLSNESVKYVFQVRTKNSVNTTAIISKYSSEDLANDNGNVGFIGEVYNGFPPIYTLEKTVATDPNQELIFQIKASKPQSLPLSVGITALRIYENYDVNKTIDENYLRSFAHFPIDGQTYTGQGIQSATAQLIDPTTIQIRVRLEQNKYLGEDFLIYATIGNKETNETDVERNAVPLGSYSGNAAPPPPTCGFVVGQHPDIPFEGYGFSYHNDLNRYFSDVKGFSQDGIIVKAKFDLLANLTLQKIVIELFVVTNPELVLERREITNTTDTSRNFILATGDQFNDVEFDFATLQLKYGFKLRYEDWVLAVQANNPNDTQNWSKYPAVFLRVNGYVQNGTFQYIYQNVSNPILIKPFEEETENTTDANVTGNIKLFSGVSEVSQLIENGLTRVVATFTGTNASNLGVANVNELWGVIRLDKKNSNGGITNIREFSTIRLPETNTPFKSQDTSGLAILQNYSANSVELVGNIDSSLLAGLNYRQGDCILVSARLGRVQPAVPTGNYVSPCCQVTVLITKSTICEPQQNTPCTTIILVTTDKVCQETQPSPVPTPSGSFLQRNVNCGVVVNSPVNETGFFVDTMTLPIGVGETTFFYDPLDVPDKFVLLLDDKKIFDSGYTSNLFGTTSPYLSQYNGELNDVTKFTDSFKDGFKAYYNVDATAQGQITGSKGSFKFTKSVNATQKLKIITHNPLQGTLSSYSVDCSKIKEGATFGDTICYQPAGLSYFALTNGLSGTYQKSDNFNGLPTYIMLKTNETLAGVQEVWDLTWRFNNTLNRWELYRSINDGTLTLMDNIVNLGGTTSNGWNITQNAICEPRFICYNNNITPNVRGAYNYDFDILYNGEPTWNRIVTEQVAFPLAFRWRYLATGWRLIQLSPTQNLNIDSRTTASINILGATVGGFVISDNGLTSNC